MPIKFLALALLTAPLALAAPPAGSVSAKVRITGEPERHGTLRAGPAGLTLETSDGGNYTIDPAALRQIAVDHPRLAFGAGKFGPGDLPAPWEHSAVGDLPHGGLAEAKTDRILVHTSSPEVGSPFESFYMASRPLPEGDAQITVRIDRIDSYEATTHGGIMLRDGTGADATNVFLSLSNRERTSMRVWAGAEAGETSVAKRDGLGPGNWLRLDRAGGKVAGYVSEDSGFWRQIASIDDPFDGPVLACLVSKGSKPRRRWSTSFHNIDVTPISVSGEIRLMRPRLTLADGSVFHSQIESATPKLFRLAGDDNAGRVLPTASIARVEFYRPITHSRRHVLQGERPGVLLPNGDFFESQLTELGADGTVTATSSLFGKRTFDIAAEVDALVLRAAAEDPPPGEFRVETWAGTDLTGKNLRVEDGQIALDTVRLRTQFIPLEKLHRIRRGPAR